MDKDFLEILDLYKKGASINGIAKELNMTEEAVLIHLNDYKKSQKEKGKYLETLMKLVAKRDSNEVPRKEIMSELNISRNFLIKSVKKFGFLDRLSEEDGEEFFTKVDSDFEFTECLQCHSKKINEVNTLYKGTPAKGFYCRDCGAEFVRNKNSIYKIKWENIN